MDVFVDPLDRRPLPRDVEKFALVKYQVADFRERLAWGAGGEDAAMKVPAQLLIANANDHDGIPSFLSDAVDPRGAIRGNAVHARIIVEGRP
jgi:hypothetical protein